MEQFKYGDFIFIGGKLQMIKNIIKQEDIYEVTLKDMNTGRMRVELLTLDMINMLNIIAANISYKGKDNKNYYFINNDTNEEYVFTIPFIGSDIEYIRGVLEKKFIETVKPVYLNVNPDNIIPGTDLVLNSLTDGAEIYYTLDGSNPTIKGILYQEPIKALDGKILKYYAKKEGMEPTFVNTFHIHFHHRPIKIFLSPSRQKYNLGHPESGFSTEMQEMNEICDILEKMLNEYNCIVYRNNPQTFIEDWSIEGRKHSIDLHLAIHSNASSGSWKKGIENWIHASYSNTYSLAYKIFENLYTIYPYGDDPLTKRGIKYALGNIAEASPAYVDFGMNLEVAYHDNLEDATWIHNNHDAIAKSILSSLVEYYQLEKK